MTNYSHARPTYDKWWMEIAHVVAKRSTCVRRRVGCVIVSEDNRILATGYNGVPAGARHCLDSPCPGANEQSGSGLDLCHALHAEQNAIARLESVDKAHTLYCTTAPCIPCTKLAAAINIRRIVAAEDYVKSGEKFWVETVGREWCTMVEDPKHGDVTLHSVSSQPGAATWDNPA